MPEYYGQYPLKYGQFGPNGLGLGLGLTATSVPGSSASYDIILGIGQSNNCGRGVYDPIIDAPIPQVMQFGGLSTDAATYQKIVSTYPMAFPEGLETNILSPMQTFGAQYFANTGRNVLLVPCAWGGTSLVSAVPNSAPDPPQWPVGGSLYLNAISQANAALAAAPAGSQVVGFALNLGENDGKNSVASSDWLLACNAMLAGLRAGITGASNAWMIIGGMLPEAQDANAGFPTIDGANMQVVLANSLTAFFQGPRGYVLADGLTLHYNAPGARLLGAGMANAVANVAVPQITYDFENDILAGTTALGVLDDSNSTNTIKIVSGPTGNALSSAGLSHLNSNFTAAVFRCVASSQTDSVVEWTETVTSNVYRSAMKLRTGAAASSTASGLRTGYMFQINGSGATASPGTVKLFLVNGTTSTQLQTANLVSVTTRRYRATAIGTTMTLSYSDDGGTTWTPILSQTDATYSAGTVQYMQGFSSTDAGVVKLDNAYFRTAV